MKNRLLKNKGKLIFEIGSKQKEEIKLLLKKNGFYINKICYDINSHPRVIISTKLYAWIIIVTITEKIDLNLTMTGVLEKDL